MNLKAPAVNSRVRTTASFRVIVRLLITDLSLSHSHYFLCCCKRLLLLFAFIPHTHCSFYLKREDEIHGKRSWKANRSSLSWISDWGNGCCCWKDYMDRQIHLLVLQNPNRKDHQYRSREQCQSQQKLRYRFWSFLSPIFRVSFWWFLSSLCFAQ